MAIALENDYVSEKLMKEIMNGVFKSEIEFNKNVIYQYYRWICYMPKWLILSLDKVKKIDYNKFRKIIDLLMLDKMYKPLFDKYLFEDDRSPIIMYKIYNYIQSISINDFASIKLNSDEYDYCIEIIRSYINCDISEIEKSISELNNKEARSMVEEFVLFCFRNILNNCFDVYDENSYICRCKVLQVEKGKVLS